MEKRLPKKIEQRLRAVREILEMKTCGFGMPGQTVTFNGGYGEEKKTEDVTEFIRERTRLWRATWALAPLDEVLHWVKTGELPRY